MEFLILYILFGFIFAIICMSVGENRDIGRTAGFWLGFFLGLIGLIIVLCSPKIVERPYIPPRPRDSIPDQIKKYKDLLDSGAITENEYNIQKNKLLNQ